MPQITLPLFGTLGNVGGLGSDGVVWGAITAQDPTKVLLKQHALTDGLCFTYDASAGTYLDDSTDFNDAGTDDVAPIQAVSATGDIAYFGHEDHLPIALWFVISTQGVLTSTGVWEYSKGGGVWGTCAGLTDGTAGFTAATGLVSVTYTTPTDAALETVDGVSAYWIRYRLTAVSAHTTAPLLTNGYIQVASADATWTDDTTDATDAGADDVAPIPTFAVVGDGMAVTYSEKFCAVQLTVSTAGAGTYTITPKVWDGTQLVAVDSTLYADDSAGYSTGTAAYLLHFVPPSSWKKNSASDGPNGNAGYQLFLELTAKTSITTPPLLTRVRVLPTTGAGVTPGLVLPSGGKFHRYNRWDFLARTISGTTADSVFLIVNTGTGDSVAVTATKALAHSGGTLPDWVLSPGEGVLVKQITKDGGTEFGSAVLTLGAPDLPG